MKPTEKQIRVIDVVLSIIKTWKNSNDINSPTHTVDIHEFLLADLENIEGLYPAKIEDLEDSLCNLLYSIQMV